MTELIVLFFNSVFINNFVLAKFLGLCPIFGVSKQLKSAIGLAVATVMVLTITCILSFIIYTMVLVPLNLAWLEIIVFIFVIAALVQAVEMIVQSKSPLLQRNVGIYLPLITTNCSVLAVAMFNIRESHSLGETIVYGIGTAVGFGLILIAFSAIREQLQSADIPETFRGSSIAMITMAIMALSFMGLS